MPNAVFIAGTLADIGLPPRGPAIILYALLLILARYRGIAVVAPAYLAVLTLDLIWTIAALFRLSPFEIASSIQYASQVRLFASPLYLGIGVALALSAAGAIRMLVRFQLELQRAGYAAPGLAALLLVVGDFWITRVPNYDTALSGAAPGIVGSAGGRSGFHQAVLGPARPDALLVVVEALGYFNEPHLRDMVMAPFRTDAILGAYEVTQGSVPFQGSTTAAELRELCGTREPFDRLTDATAAGCLPALLRAQGRDSTAIHGFSGSMFDRRDWYPLIGFRQAGFRRDLSHDIAERCGSVFVGPCDTSIAPRLPDMAGQRGSGRLIYWLTLNTHVPIRPGEATPRFDCAQGGGAFGHGEVCQMAEMWVDVMEAIARLSLDPRMRPAEILIVGDHAPPLWSRRGRNLFHRDVVPWIRLSPRS